ncbi:MAG TPA: hypothetical protein VKG25_21520 [Bryobacteraceae bacterium]|nr:hypothetical protein [Bryobacteraceae bacterium]
MANAAARPDIRLPERQTIAVHEDEVRGTRLSILTLLVLPHAQLERGSAAPAPDTEKWTPRALAVVRAKVSRYLFDAGAGKPPAYLGPG